MTAYRPNCRRIPELNGLRVLLVFIVSWYHFWQQSWLTPSIGRYSLDYLLRAGYMPVDGTILLSGFLLFLPYARTMMLGERVPDTKAFYQRRIMRIVPSYYFLTLLMLVAVAIPYNLYGRTSEAVRDVYWRCIVDNRHRDAGVPDFPPAGEGRDEEPARHADEHGGGRVCVPRLVFMAAGRVQHGCQSAGEFP